MTCYLHQMAIIERAEIRFFFNCTIPLPEKAGAYSPCRTQNKLPSFEWMEGEMEIQSDFRDDKLFGAQRKAERNVVYTVLPGAFRITSRFSSWTTEKKITS